MARFTYYRRLSRARQTIYRRSDEIERILLPPDHGLDSRAADLSAALSAEDRGLVTSICHDLVVGICTCLDASPVSVRVLAKRPSNDREELHGLYQPEDGGELAQITVWMRTAKRLQVVAFRTFLRTLLHELCHHLDYEYLKLDESFHLSLIHI